MVSRRPSADESEQVRVHLETLTGADVMRVSGVELSFDGMMEEPVAGAYRAIIVNARRRPGALTEWVVEDRDTGDLLARVRARRLRIDGRNLRLNLKPIPGGLTLAPRGAGFDVIATVGLEDYVRGVLPAEMPWRWPIEALKAQAIASRTYALFRKSLPHARSEDYDLETTVMDQMYKVPIVSESRAKIDKAVDETRGMVLAAGAEIGGSFAPLASYFHADCGGSTEDAVEVWGDQGAGVAVDRGCPLNPLAKWQTEISLVELTRRMRSAAGKAAAEVTLAGVSAVGSTRSGRVALLRLDWTDGDATFHSAHEFRMAVGHEVLKSTRFEISASKAGRAALVFAGRGFGHGVGMCQWGARHLANSGVAFREILRHYYPLAQLTVRRRF